MGMGSVIGEAELLGVGRVVCSRSLVESLPELCWRSVFQRSDVIRWQVAPKTAAFSMGVCWFLERLSTNAGFTELMFIVDRPLSPAQVETPESAGFLLCTRKDATARPKTVIRTLLDFGLPVIKPACLMCSGRSRSTLSGLGPWFARNVWNKCTTFIIQNQTKFCSIYIYIYFFFSLLYFKEHSLLLLAMELFITYPLIAIPA